MVWVSYKDALMRNEARWNEEESSLELIVPTTELLK